ncbi:MAG TPA: hypothetical protein DCX01_04005 [Bacteroidetes bacterium]|nr:hypothetical protein [Bacteroidota bacterium]
MRNIFLLVLLVCISLFISRFSHEHSNTNDGKEYTYAAHNLLHNNTLYSGNLDAELDYRLFSKRTVGFPLILLFQHINPYILAVFQILLILISFFLGLQLLRHYTLKRQAFLLYSIGFITQLAFLLHVGFVLSDLLLASLISILVLIYYTSKSSFKVKTIAISVLWASALLVKPILLPTAWLSPLIFVFILVKHKKAEPFTLLPFLAFLVFSFFNYTSTKIFEYSSISTINLTQYNAKLAMAKKYGYDSAQHFVNSPSLAIPRTEAEYSSYLANAKEMGVSAILKNLTAYTQVHILGCIKTIVDPGRFELYTFFNETTNETSLTEMMFSRNWNGIKKSLSANYWLIIVLLVSTLFSLLKFLGFVFCLRSGKEMKFLLLTIAYFVVITGPVGAARFFLPVSILFIVCSAIGWGAILQFFQKSSKRQ